LATNSKVKKKIGHQFGDPIIGARVKALRESLGLDQKGFAPLVGVKQPIVSQWESAKHRPSTLALRALGDMAGTEKGWWYEQAGQGAATGGAEKELAEGETVWVPLMHDAVSAGLGRAVRDDEVDRHIPFVRAFMPRGGKLRALRVTGDSMAPIIQDGYIVVVDASQREAKRLVGKMVAAR